MSQTNQPNESDNPDDIDLNAIAEAAKEGTQVTDQAKIDAITRSPEMPTPEDAEKLATLRETVQEAHEAEDDRES